MTNAERGELAYQLTKRIVIDLATARAAVDAAVAALAQPVAAEPEMWRHKKSGGVYEFLMSVVNEADQDIHVVYRSVETCVRWSRRSIEFYDGRFERLPPTPA